MPETQEFTDINKINYYAEISLILAVAAAACVCLLLNDRDLPEIVSIVGFASWLTGLILAIIGRRQRGEARRVATFALGVTALTFFIMGIHSIDATHAPLARKNQFSNNLRMIGLALQNYASANDGRLPPAVVRDANGQPLYSWRVLILPYMEEQQLYEQFHLDERWDSPHNIQLLSQVPWAYRPIGFDAPTGVTFIQVFVGPGTAFENPSGEPFGWGPAESANFPDGKEKTIFAIEAGSAVPWSAPFDLPYDPKGPILPPGGGYRRPSGMFSSQPIISSFQILMADTTFRTEVLPLDEKGFRAKITRNGGEPVPSPEHEH